MRSDAREHREALIRAATACFGQYGYQAPLEKVARMAGVGRGTLYRNFPDRVALIVAIFEHQLDAIEADVDFGASLIEVMRALVRGGVRTTAMFNRLSSEIDLQPEDLTAFQTLSRRVCERLQPVVDRAQAAGELRAGISAEQIMIAIRMVNAVIVPQYGEAEREARAAMVLDLLFQGLAPRG